MYAWAQKNLTAMVSAVLPDLLISLIRAENKYQLLFWPMQLSSQSDIYSPEIWANPKP